MKTRIETERLILRELVPEDEAGFFAMDSNPEVHRYIGRDPVTNIEQIREAIENIRNQYVENGIGRWAVILKETGEFIGWSGLKVERNVNGHDRFYDLGYRFGQEHWGKGYACESARAFVDLGFNEMKLSVINAYVDVENKGSRNVLEKCGLRSLNTFICDGDPHLWYELKNPHL